MLVKIQRGNRALNLYPTFPPRYLYYTPGSNKPRNPLIRDTLFNSGHPRFFLFFSPSSLNSLPHLLLRRTSLLLLLIPGHLDFLDFSSNSQ